MSPEFKTISAAAAGRELGLGKAKTLQLIREGRLPAKDLDGRIRVRVADLAAFIEALPSATREVRS
jgi:hypothetical protein